MHIHRKHGNLIVTFFNVKLVNLFRFGSYLTDNQPKTQEYRFQLYESEKKRSNKKKKIHKLLKLLPDNFLMEDSEATVVVVAEIDVNSDSFNPTCFYLR